MKTLDDIKLPDDVRALLDRLVEVTKELCDPEAIILFGSWAEGRAKPDSDIDVIVIVDVPDPWDLAFRIRREILSLDRGIDILVLTPDDWERYREWPAFAPYYAARLGVMVLGRAA